MWGGVAYYLMLFLIACLCVAIFGKILKVYDLTLKMQGKKGFNWNNIMGICCLIFLIAGMYGAYWSLTVQGSMKLPVAASEHGGAIDEHVRSYNRTYTHCICYHANCIIWVFISLQRIR